MARRHRTLFPRTARRWALAAGAGLLGACGTTVEPPSEPVVDPAITIALDRSTITVSAGEAAQPIRVTLARAGAATGAVDLTVAGLPSGVRASITPPQLSGTATTATIDLTATTTAAAGTSTATVRATSGALASQVTLAVTVRRP